MNELAALQVTAQFATPVAAQNIVDILSGHLYNLNMSVPILVILASAYSICLIHITLFIGIFVKHKNKIELCYLLVLLNIFLLAMVVLLSYIYNKDNVIFIFVNSAYSLYITIPVYSYYLFGVDKKYYMIIPILVGMEAVIDNILLRLD
ncbi:MAG: hypothetical protein LBH43_01085, partial [Treponema sp.]|nr:hypothetical protein [Treponema sp.]